MANYEQEMEPIDAHRPGSLDVYKHDESRVEPDDGRADRIRRTVNKDPRESITTHSVPSPFIAHRVPTAVPDPKIQQADPTSTELESTDDGKAAGHSAAVAPRVPLTPTGKPHINLCQAVQDGKEEVVKQWLLCNKHQPSRNHYSDKDGLYPIHYAAKFNQPKIMKLLCEQGKVDVRTVTTIEGYTPLHLAARYNPHGDYELAAKAKAKASGDNEGSQTDYKSYTLSFRRQQSSEAAIKYLMEKVDVNAEDRYGITPLHLACQVGNFEGVQMLLTSERIKLDAKDGDGDTPLHEACFHGKEMTTKLLLETMKNKNMLDLAVKNDLGLTPFHVACLKGYFIVANHLLKFSADRSKLVMAVDNEGATPLHLACQNDNKEIVSLLLEHKADVFACKFDDIIPVHVAAQFGCLSVMDTLLDHQEKQSTPTPKEAVDSKDDAPLDHPVTPKDAVNAKDNYDQTPLHFAAENGKEKMMMLLLDKGADKEAKDIDHYTPLLTAAEFGRIGCFKLLLQHRASIDAQNKDKKNAVFLAAESNHPEIVAEIIQNHGSKGKNLLSTPDTLLNTPLHVAAEKGNLETLMKLLESQEVNECAKNVLGKTAMHLAAEKGHTHIIAAFCPDIVKSTDENGDTPLHLACSHGYVEVAKHLIKGGADIEARNAVRRTPIDCAAFYGHARVIELLVSFKADINSKDKLKATPLQLAAKEGHVTAVETLLKHNASMTSLDQRKFNALDWAIENGHSDVAEAIVKSVKWISALVNYTRTQDGEITSPFRKLIQRMPDVAEMVLNRCTGTNADRNVRPDSEDYAVTFNYKFLEDREQVLEWKEDEHREKHSQEEGQMKTTKKWLCYGSSSHKHKHPMKVMVDSKRTELLKHPLVYNLIEHKWTRYGRALFYTALTFHVVFVIFLMAFSLVLLNPLSPTCVAVSSGQFGLTQPGDQVSVNVSQLGAPHDATVADYLSDMNTTVTDGIASIDGNVLCFNTTKEIRDALDSVLLDLFEPICGQCGQSRTQMIFLEIAAVLIILYSIIRLVLEFGYFTQQLYLYFFDIATWVNVPLYIFAIIFVSIFGRECLCPPEWQWQVGIAAVFLVWAHLILYMRRMRVLDTGIYVLMFKNIFIRFLKLTILTVLLLLMFALTFYMAFRQFGFLFAKSPFANPGHSILKTISMSIGELGYDELFRQPTGGSTDNVPGIPFPEISYILWIIFIILMPILFGNLLVGLAVDDIKGILEAAALTRLALRVELVLSLEDRFWFLRHLNFFQKKLHVKSLTIQPHKGRIKKLIFPLMRLLRGENYTSAEHISHVLNPTKTPIEQQTQTLMREISKMQETLKEIPKMQEVLYKLMKQTESKSTSSKTARVVAN